MVDEHVAIQGLSNDVLLCIFLFLRPRCPYLPSSLRPKSSLTWAWHRLAHVCRRWRYLIFTSPRRLGLGLVASKKRRGTTLDLWPPLPISIYYDSPWTPSLEDEQDVITTLEHSDRIFEIKLTISNTLLNSNVWMESFPTLERLCLSSPPGYHHSTALPSGFLGGSALASRRLRYIVLKRVSIPTLPQLLLSSRGLIHLYLGEDVLTGDGFLSPAVLSAALSAAAQLKSLHVHLPSNIFHEEQGSTDSGLPPPNLVALPALIYFKSDGPDEYLEDLVSRIHAPLLERICVCVPQQHVQPLDIPRLSQFISRTERMSSLPFQTSILLEESGFRISHDFGIRGHICFEFTCDLGLLEVSQVDHIYRQLTPLMSDVGRVSIEVNITPPNLPDETDVARWLQLFRLCGGAQELELNSEYPVYEAHGSPKLGQEVLPALRILRVYGFDMRLPRFIESFVAERELTGRPITLLRPCGGFESGPESA